VLGLAPNGARSSVRFWIQGTVGKFREMLFQHFKDLEINHQPNEKPYLPVFRFLVSIANRGKADNIPPNLAGEMMRAILGGLPYPETLLQGAIRRIRAEQNVLYPRAALLKAYINRKTRHRDPSCEDELKVSLD
jgi:CRISPR-associated protein Csd1